MIIPSTYTNGRVLSITPAYIGRTTQENRSRFSSPQKVSHILGSKVYPKLTLFKNEQPTVTTIDTGLPVEFQTDGSIEITGPIHKANPELLLAHLKKSGLEYQATTDITFLLDGKLASTSTTSFDTAQPGKTVVSPEEGKMILITTITHLGTQEEIGGFTQTLDANGDIRPYHSDDYWDYQAECTGYEEFTATDERGIYTLASNLLYENLEIFERVMSGNTNLKVSPPEWHLN